MWHLITKFQLGIVEIAFPSVFVPKQGLIEHIIAYEFNCLNRYIFNWLNVRRFRKHRNRGTHTYLRNRFLLNLKKVDSSFEASLFAEAPSFISVSR